MTADRRNSPPILWKIGWRYLVKRPWQTLFMIVGVMIGVAVMVAIDLANASASQAFNLSTEAVVGKATHQIIGSPQGIPEAVYIDLRRSGLTQFAAPVISEYVTSPRLGGQPFQILGVDPFAEAPFRDYLNFSSGPPVAGITAFISTPGAILLSRDTAEQYGLTIGDTLELEIGGNQATGVITGLLNPVDELSRRGLEGILLVDIATAQEFTGRFGMIDRIDLIIQPDTSGLLSAIEAKLPSGVRLTTVAARTGTVEELTAAFRVNLTALSLLALVVGMFLIYNTMTFSVVQRRSLFGTMRSLGVTRQEVFLLVLVEALVVGVISTGLGLILGVALGQGALGLVTRTINDLFFVVTVRSVSIPTTSLVKGVVIGLGATLLSAAVPALEAASVQPREALSRSMLESKTRQLVRFAAPAGLILIVVGIGLLALDTGNLTFSFIGTFAVIVAFAAITPLATIAIMRLAGPLTGRIWGTLGRMAPREVVNSLSRTAIAVAALMVAISVIIGVSIMVSSFRFTVVTWLDQTLQGDIYISPPSLTATQNSNLVSEAALEVIESQPGIDRVDSVRSVTVESPNGPIQIAAARNPGTSEERLYKSRSGSNEEITSALEAGAVLVSEPLANRLNLPSSGGNLELFTALGPRAFPVAGIYFDYASSQGTALMTQEVYQEFWGDPAITAVALRLAPGIDPDEFIQTLNADLAPVQQLIVRPNRILREEVLEVFDRTFDITTALQLLATVVAFIGVLSALFSQQIEKQRQFGILRAVGLSVRQLWQLVLLETGLMGAVAGMLALPTGLALSWILIFIINRRSFGWTLQMQVSPEPFLQAMVIALAAAILAGIYPAYRISRRITADAIRFE